jgi:TonB family protein
MGLGFAGGAFAIPVGLMLWLTAAYAGTMLYFVARLILGVWRTYRLDRAAQGTTVAESLMREWERCQSRFGIAGAGIAISSGISGPVTVGLRRSVLLLPPVFVERTGDADRDALMAHECAHMQRHDFAKNLLYRIASLPVACHPFLWLTLTRIAESREMVCDAMAADAIAGRESYARSLLRLASMVADVTPIRTIHAIGIFDANAFERRVMRLTGRRVEMGRALRVTTAAACVAVGAATCASALALRVEVASPKPAAAADKKEAPSTVKVPSSVIAGNAIYQKHPVYPAEAKANHIEGAVVMAAIISKEGTMERLEVVSGPEELRASSIDAVKEWRYKPYLLNGEPTAVETKITVNYSLEN